MSALSRSLRMLILPVVAGLVATGIGTAAPDSPRPPATAPARDTKIHWSLTPLVKPPVPPLASHPIDAFIRARLAGQRLDPSPRADARSLLRRLSYDLTGLPPTTEEVEAFAEASRSSPRPDALYAAEVDRLLASPRYGEHWARHSRRRELRRYPRQ